MKNTHNLQGKYRHHKGNYYDVLGEARDIDSNELYILYQPNYGERHWWIRPKEMFFEGIIYKGEKQPRFKKISSQIDCPEIKTEEFLVRHTETGTNYFALYMDSHQQYFLSLKSKGSKPI